MCKSAIGLILPKRRQIAMNREIARGNRGNFRGVCPKIGRLREVSIRCVDRCAMCGTGRIMRAGFSMSRNDTQRTDTSLSRPIFGHTPRKLPRSKTSNLPVHRNLSAFGQDTPNRGLAHRNKKGCICQYNFSFFSEKFFASQDVPKIARFRTRYPLFSPAPWTYSAALPI